MTPLRRLVLFAACAAAAGNNTTRVNKETKPADQTLVETDGLNQTCAVNETKPAVADQTFVQNATTGENQTHTVDVTTSTDGTYANITPNMTLVNFENKSRKARNSAVVVGVGSDGPDGPDGRGGLGGRHSSLLDDDTFEAFVLLRNPHIELGYLLRKYGTRWDREGSDVALELLAEIRSALLEPAAA